MATRAEKPLKAVPTVEDALNELQPQLTKLRVPFQKHQISKLPKPYKKDSPKGKCAECGGYHGLPAVHLDYVGHAALTDRLLDTDLEWSWEPVGFTPEGLPAHDKNGGLWIKLTVCGVTRYGYGAADGKSGGDAVKEIIGDALRNAAMRFGAALDLWHKGDLHADDEPEPTPKPEPRPVVSDAKHFDIAALAKTAGVSVQTICEAANVSELNELSDEKAESIIKKLNLTIGKKKAAANADILDDEIPY